MSHLRHVTLTLADYEEDSGAHILTYQFGTQKEEKERVALSLKRPDELQVSVTSSSATILCVCGLGMTFLSRLQRTLVVPGNPINAQGVPAHSRR
jgi:hypothetical protein